MQAIVYTSNAGSTARYAKMLSQATGLPTYALAEARHSLPAGAEIIYAGWVMANCVKGYAAAAKRFSVQTVCAVGMAETGMQLEITRQKSSSPADIPLFTLQGNFNLQKLRGTYRLLMWLMVRALKKKADRTPEESAMLEMLCDGIDRVDARNLAAVIDWYGKRKEEKNKWNQVKSIRVRGTRRPCT